MTSDDPLCPFEINTGTNFKGIEAHDQGNESWYFVENAAVSQTPSGKLILLGMGTTSILSPHWLKPELTPGWRFEDDFPLYDLPATTAPPAHHTTIVTSSVRSPRADLSSASRRSSLSTSRPVIDITTPEMTPDRPHSAPISPISLDLSTDSSPSPPPPPYRRTETSDAQSSRRAPATPARREPDEHVMTLRMDGEVYDAVVEPASPSPRPTLSNRRRGLHTVSSPSSPSVRHLNETTRVVYGSGERAVREMGEDDTVIMSLGVEEVLERMLLRE
ncbi:hypothetical protein FB45DRAFT_1054597 [Roridomyces roridus]|uniref:Uncharacterized protein n=1 Tax=Roridomyces roridus TaxID=1738132 RepID=A0AAD7C3K6_9AGAR|nr:hypothetical protein FB45DRAFT_1054597 [Roridomyces roridus]